tara:strand:- start:1726 stop:2262 length:537 start_codon:yes stop_codon:yes gene_type:complete
MSFFTKFPKLAYDIAGNNEYKLVTDILRRVKIRSSIKDNASLLDKYDIRSGETPEQVAYKIYGDSTYHYLIFLMNNITDRYYGWPLSDYGFEQFVKDKYSNPGAIHHYEITQSSGRTTSNGPEDYSHKIEVNSDVAGAEAVSNYEYERRLQEEKRQIQLLDPAYLPTFEQEFSKLVRK